MLFEPFENPRLSLTNRIVMAPMTRSRATLNNTANALMAKYYSQRASAGLIITEGTSPSPNGLGYARIPGIFNDAHVSGWRTVTDAVHRAGGKIFVQLMHTGRVSATENLPVGATVVSVTDAICPGKMFTDTAGMQPHAKPHAMTESDIQAAVAEYAHACELADDAGFDGVEIHGANGYLVEQFLNANINTRTDGYGGSADARNRFALEVAAACVAKIGGDRVGIRLSPHGVFNGSGPFAGVDEQYVSLAQQLSKLGLFAPGRSQ
jgi:N-ethylmaleimide reductase